MKGLSEIIAAVVLIAIVLVIGLYLANWSTELAEEELTGPACMQRTSYLMESVDFNETGRDMLKVKVRNYGDLGLYGFGAVISNMTDTEVFPSASIDQQGITRESPLGKGESAYIWIDMSGNAELAGTMTQLILTNKPCNMATTQRDFAKN